MAKRPVPLYDFAAFGQAIKAARTARKESRKDVSDAMNISPRYLISGTRTRTVKAPKPQRSGINLLIDIKNCIKAQESKG